MLTVERREHEALIFELPDGREIIRLHIIETEYIINRWGRKVFQAVFHITRSRQLPWRYN